MRTLLKTWLLIPLLLLGVATLSQAQARFPSKPVRITIGFPAGGPLDQHARLLSDRLQQVLGQPVIIDYKAGAGGTVGAQEVMKAAPDGHSCFWPTPARW